MHVHIDLVGFLTTGAYLVLFGFFWRTLSTRWADRPAGQAMAFIY